MTYTLRWWHLTLFSVPTTLDLSLKISIHDLIRSKFFYTRGDHSRYYRIPNFQAYLRFRAIGWYGVHVETELYWYRPVTVFYPFIQSQYTSGILLSFPLTKFDLKLDNSYDFIKDLPMYRLKFRTRYQFSLGKKLCLGWDLSYLSTLRY